MLRDLAFLSSCIVLACAATVGCGGATCGEPAFGSEALCVAPAPRLAVNVDGERQCVGENMGAVPCVLVTPSGSTATMALHNIGRRDGLDVSLSGDVSSTDDVTIEASTRSATLDRAESLDVEVTAARETTLTWQVETNASGTDPVVGVELRFE